MGTGNFIRYGEQGYQDKNHIYGATNEMDYDANGNMTKDLDRNIVTIKYNLLNLPEIIQFGNGNQIRNTYDAGGQKLKTVYSTLGTPIVVPINNIGNLGDPNNCSDFIHGTDYVGNIEYSFSNDCGDYQHDLSMIYNTEGYVTGLFVNTGPNYQYFRKDHLGNNREVWNATTNTTVQRTHYYPSGLPWNSSTGIGASVHNKKYNGKEFVEMHGLDEYDSKARSYYPAIMRTTTIDPLAEKHYSISPYAWCTNNPVNRVDPNGMDDYILTRDGRLVLALSTKDKKDKVWAINKAGKIDKNNSTEISKDFISSKTTETIKTINLGKVQSTATVDVFTTFRDKESTDFFEFAAKNTDVEWTHVKATIDGLNGYEEVNYIGTSHIDGKDACQSFILDFIPQGVRIREANHSHTNGTSTVSPDDTNLATKIQTKFPNATFNIYSRIGDIYKYKSYDMYSTPGLLNDLDVIHKK